MTQPVDLRFRKAMTHLPIVTQREVLQKYYDYKGETAQMQHALGQLTECLRSAVTASYATTPERRELYLAYAALLRKTKATITAALRATPENPDPTLASIREARRKVNLRREAEGRPPLGSRGRHWADWIPPHVRDKTLDLFAQVYAREPLGPQRHRRIEPFTTVTQRRAMRAGWEKLLPAAQEHVAAWAAEMYPSFVQQERRRAALAALRIIKTKTMPGTTLQYTDVPPVSWVYVLPDDTRAHLRAAEKEEGGDGFTRGMLTPEPRELSEGDAQ